MVKLRAANYCNLKLFLIFLVIYGHLIEPGIYRSEVLMLQYKSIYFVHMPLFCFLSELFLRSEKDCVSQLKRAFPLYAVLQMLAVVLGGGKVRWLTPWWHLWYLLSYAVWLCLAWLWFRHCGGRGRCLLLICSAAAGCLIGYAPSVGRLLSLSRTVVFLPYFLAGVFCRPSMHWKRYRIAGIAALALAVGLMYFTWDQISAVFLYQASSFTANAHGAALRLVCYLIGGLLGVFLLTVIPTQRLPFSKLGANTMSAYVLHAPIVLYLRKQEVPWPIHLVFAAAFLYLLFVLTRWYGQLYGIVSAERSG